MAKARVISLSVIGIIAFLIIVIGGGWYVYEQQTYVSTADASVQGTLVPLTAPGNGTLTGWRAAVGKAVNQNTLLGTVEGLSGNVNLSAPITGTVVQNLAVDHETVVPGEPLGYMVDLNNLQIVANVQETEINNVAVGKTVNITISAYPNTTFTGTVTQIGSASSVVTNGIPNTSLSGTFNKETQRVPVYISIAGSEGKDLMPGMSAQVSIYRN
ncbi:MAG: HlyD family secretion protein [Bacilli bacterium]